MKDVFEMMPNIMELVHISMIYFRFLRTRNWLRQCKINIQFKKSSIGKKLTKDNSLQNLTVWDGCNWGKVQIVSAPKNSLHNFCISKANFYEKNAALNMTLAHIKCGLWKKWHSFMSEYIERTFSSTKCKSENWFQSWSFKNVT